MPTAMQRTLVAALFVALILAAAPVQGKSEPFFGEVKAGDGDVGVPFQSTHAPVAFIDGNGNGKADASDPDEPLYLDLDASGTVSHSDLRLTVFLGHGAGTLVDLADADAGRILTNSASAFLARSGSTWWLDLAGNYAVDVGDLRLDASGPVKMHAGDAGLGTTLTVGGSAQTGFVSLTEGSTSHAVVYIDEDAYGNGGGHVTPGDLRFTAQTATSAASGPAASLVTPGESGWRLLDGILVVLAVLNLAGLLFVVRTVNQLRGPPKNPFK